MELVIVTGLSGSGKSRTMDALEDIGYFCIDNMPPQLIEKIIEICGEGKNGKLSKIAIAIDARAGNLFESIYDTLNNLKSNNVVYKVLFLDCSDDVLRKRYKETRRKHPLDDGVIGTGSAIKNERHMLEKVKIISDYIIDTSLLSTAQLKERISTLFIGDIKKSMIVHCMSFGFKYGLPAEADLVFDVRCLPNPFYTPELKYKTGLDSEVEEFVMQNSKSKEFEAKLKDMIDYLLPLYLDEGKSQLVIAIGCTGGKHRSVVFSKQICSHIANSGLIATINHRDINKN